MTEPWRYTTDDLANFLCAEVVGESASFSNVSTDTRALQPGDLFVALQGENFDGTQFVDAAFKKGAAAALTTHAAETGPCVVVDNSLVALQQFAQHHRAQYDLPIIAITGSCGKTSAKDFTHAVLGRESEQGPAVSVVKTPGNFNNEIGCPLSLLQLQQDTQMAVIEMGANHVGEIEFLCGLAKPTESAITMIAPAHLEGFGSIEGVIKAKSEIMQGLPPEGRFYVNLDDPVCTKIGQEFSGETFTFGRAEEADVRLDHFAFDESGDLVLDISPIGQLKLPLPIPAQITNVLLAVAIGLQHGVETFEEPLRRACQRTTRFRIEEIGPITVLDDSYNASPASVDAALHALSLRAKYGKRFAALGEMLELGEDAAAFHREAGEAAARYGISHLFTFGPHAGDQVSGARAGGVPNAATFTSPKSIAEAIFACATPGCCVLVKGSRGMRMEGVTEALRKLYKAA
jgi:UDP-N-acetylmuramoyl-tripeptide--D-alanyl-D-alanine ligase